MNAPVKTPRFEEKPRDCYCTPDELLDLIRGPSGFWSAVDFDPFGDPESHVRPVAWWDVRRGQDAYALGWPVSRAAAVRYGTTRRSPRLENGPLRLFGNGPYSGGNPQRTAKRTAQVFRAGVHCMNLCPAAPGSNYWRELVWPTRPAIAWLGRLPFRAGRDIFGKDGKLVVKKGEILKANRTEIALVYQGPERERFEYVFGQQYEVTLV